MNTTTTEKNRIHWSEDEVDLLAKEFVKLRIKDPYTSVGIIFDTCQEAIMPNDRRRAITSIGYVPGLRERINKYWSETVHAEPAPPRIIHVETQAPIDYVKAINELGLSTLVGMTFERLIQTFAPNAEHPTSNGESNVATAKLAPPTVTIQSLLSKKAEEEKKKLPRIVICTHDTPLFAKVKNAVENGKIPVELRLVDLDDRSPAIPHTATHIVFPHVCTGPTWRLALENWPRKNIFLIPKEHTGTIENAVIQKVRDISSMQRAT